MNNENATTSFLYYAVTRRVCFGYKFIVLRKKEAEFIETISASNGRLVCHGSLISRLWPMDEPEDPAAAIRCIVARIRTALSKAGMPGCIQSSYGSGYSIVPGFIVDYGPRSITLSPEKIALLRRFADKHRGTELADRVIEELLEAT